MRNILIYFAALLSICLSAATAVYGADAKPDERLKTKVTLDCVGVRVHDVIERISAETKVDIRSGFDKEDWRARDLPILVCAHDISLANLLKGIADASHLTWTSTKLKNDELYYRVYRDSKTQQQLDGLVKTKSEAQLAAAKYDWDTFSEFTKVPESEFEDYRARNSSTPESSRLWDSQTRDVANICSLLGNEARDRVLDGEKLILSVDNAPESVKPYIRTVFEKFWAASEDYASRNGHPSPEPLDEKRLSRCYIRISFENGGMDPGDLSIQVWGRGFTKIDVPNCSGYVRKVIPETPVRPKVHEAILDSDKLDSSYPDLDLEAITGSALLETKFKVEISKDKKNNSYYDLLCGASKASGYSIIAEGSAARYILQVMTDEDKLKGMFGKEVTVRQALEFATGLNNQQWYINEQRKIILGRDKKWTEHLAALVPQKILLDAQKKLNADGIDLNDLEPLVGLSENQLREWLWNCPEMPELSQLSNAVTSVGANSLERLYFALDSETRKQALSGKAVPLTGVDVKWLTKLLRDQASSTTENMLANKQPYDDSQLSDLEAFKIKLANSKLISSLQLQISKVLLPKEYEKQRMYVFAVKTAGDEVVKFEESMQCLFPITAPKPKPEAAAAGEGKK